MVRSYYSVVSAARTRFTTELKKRLLQRRANREKNKKFNDNGKEF
jgi:hypothetical protein